MMPAQANEMEVKMDNDTSLVSVTDAIEKEWQRHKVRMQDIRSNRRTSDEELCEESPSKHTWKQQIEVLESRFGVSKMVAQLLAQRAQQAHEERLVAQSKVRDLTREVQRSSNEGTTERHKIAKKLTKARKIAGEKEEMVEKLTTQCEQQSRQLQQIQQDLSDAISQSKQENQNSSQAPAAAASEEEILAQRMRLAGADRVIAYLDIQLHKSRISEAQLALQVLTLEGDLTKLARKLTKLDSEGAPPKKLQKVIKNIEPIKARLLQVQGVTQAFQRQLLEMQQAKQRQESERAILQRHLQEMQERLKRTSTTAGMTTTTAPVAEIQVDHQAERIAELEEQLVQAKKVLKSVVDKWGPVKAENQEQLESLKEENKTLQERLQKVTTTAENDASSTANRPRADERRLFRQVGDLEGKLAESKRVVRFLEGLVTKTRGEKANAELKAKTAEEQLEELQSQFKKMDSRHKAEVNAFKAFSCLAHKVGDYVKTNPNFTPGASAPGQPPQQGVQVIDLNLSGMPRPQPQATGRQTTAALSTNPLAELINRQTSTTTTTTAKPNKPDDDSSGAEESTAETSSTGSIDM